MKTAQALSLVDAIDSRGRWTLSKCAIEVLEIMVSIRAQQTPAQDLFRACSRPLDSPENQINGRKLTTYIA